MKYLIPVNKVIDEVKQIFMETPTRSGFYNWRNVMEADMASYNSIKDNTDNWDVIHVNMNPSNWWFILELGRKLKNSSTKLVLNNDHVSEFWHRWELDPSVYLQVQECGDVVFGTEPFQTSQMIDRAFWMPHPSNIREMNIERANKLKTLVDTYHVPIICTAELRKKTKQEGKDKAPTIHDFMETGKFGYNANVAWLLSSEYN